MTTLEEGQRLLDSLTVFYIIITKGPDGFAQVDSNGEKFIAVWSSGNKAKRFIYGQGRSKKNSRIVGVDVATLQTLAREVGIKKMVLDCEASASPESKFIWFYLRSVGVQ